MSGSVWLSAPFSILPANRLLVSLPFTCMRRSYQRWLFDKSSVVLAEAFGVSRRQVTLVAGERARQKRVRIDGLSVDEATAVVAAAASRR